MNWLTATISLYASVASRAARVSLVNWPVLLSVFAYSLLMRVTLPIALALGLLGGFLLGFVYAACIASFLYLVERLVRYGRVSFEEFSPSFAPYFWDVIGVMFILWMLRTILSLAVMTNPQGVLISAVVELLLFVFLNAVPELIYLGHHSSMDLLTESYQFISENWIEWFPPTLLAVAILSLVMGIPSEGWLSLAKWAAAALFVYFTMVMRGLLFEELSGSTRRSRTFRSKFR